jgi:hypothetical protein
LLLPTHFRELKSTFSHTDQGDFPKTPRRETSVPTGAIQFPEPVLFTPTTSRESSLLLSTSSEESEESESQGSIRQLHHDGFNSPPPEDERAIQGKNERKYRMLLKHDYHPSRKYILGALESMSNSL